MYYLYPGALHMHTPYSDGTGTVAEIARAARSAGLRWIIITDHDTLEARAEEGIYGGVIVLVGHEVTPDKNHLLVFNTPVVIDRAMSPAECIARVAELGGVSFIAHPDERTNNEIKQPFEWEDWSVRGFTGIELWNYMSEWMEAITPRRKFLNYFLPSITIKGPTKRTLAWWDQLHREGHRAVGVAGSDVHQARVQALGLTWVVFPYEQVFRTLTNYLVLEEPLAEDFELARSQIYQALRDGRVIIANRFYGEVDGVSFTVESGGTRVTVGEELRLAGRAQVTFRAPKSGRIRLVRDGQTVCTQKGSELLLSTHRPGSYRIEMRRWGQPWIFTNHIRVAKR